MTELMPILQVASPWGVMAVALFIIFKLVNGKGGKDNPTQVTERLCMARRGETAAKLEAIEDKLDTAIELIKNGGKS